MNPLSEITVTVLGFFLFWGAIAWASKGEKGFFATFLDRIGLGFYYKRVWPALFVWQLPQCGNALPLLTISLSGGCQSLVALSNNGLLVTPFVLLPLFIVFQKQELARRVISAVSAVWFTMILLGVITFAILVWIFAPR
jgi:hypothetical protein